MAGFSLITYLKNAYAELRKVTWPKREQALQSTMTVIVFTVGFAFFLGLVDYILNLGLDQLISLKV